MPEGKEAVMTKQKLREARSRAHREMKALLDGAVAEDRGLTEEEQKRYDALKAEHDRAKTTLAMLEETESIGASLDEPEEPKATKIPRLAGPVAEPAKREFETFGEFVAAVRFRPSDQRLQYGERSGERSEQRMDDGPSGGFMVPRQFVPTLMQAPVDAALVRPRATVIPAGDPPDAEVELGALDQTDSPTGGVEVVWIGEGDEKPSTDAKIRQIRLAPQEVAGHITVTDKLLRNWGAAGPLLEAQLRTAISIAEDIAFITGSGVGKPLGFLSPQSAGTIKVPRKGSGKISYEDILALDEAFKSTGGTGVYIYSRKALTAIKQIVDGDGRFIWQGSAAEGAPPTLNGRPAFMRDELPGLGNTGDLCLVDLSAYLIKDGSGPFVQASEHVHFKQNKTVIKVFWNVDGQPWVSAPMKTLGGDTVSPFVALKKETT